MENIIYTSSKAVKINNDMRNNLNIYNQRNESIRNYTKQIEDNEKAINEKNQEIDSLQNEGSRDSLKKAKVCQKEVDKIISANNSLEKRKDILIQNNKSASIEGVQMKTFPEEKIEDNNLDSSTLDNEVVGEYKEGESFVPVTENKKTESKLSNDDVEAIWNGLHQYEEPVAPVYDEPKDVEPVAPVYDEPKDVEPVAPAYEEPKNIEPVVPVYDEPKNIEPVVINEMPVEFETPLTNKEANIVEPTVIEGEEESVEDTTSAVEKEIHEQVNNEFPKIDVPEPMDSEKKLRSIYNDLDVEPVLPDDSKNRDLKNLTLFVDYNDYTFAFAQQHYNKEALKPDEIENLIMVKSYLSEKDFHKKRTTQYGKITAENKRLNKKIVSLSKEFTKTVDKLSKEYVNTTQELTDQTLKATEQIEIDRVEKVQTQRLNTSLTDNIKEQANHIEELVSENTGLKETIDARDNTIKDLEKVVKDQADKIKVFEEKLNTVLGIVKEVKGERKNINKA